MAAPAPVVPEDQTARVVPRFTASTRTARVTTWRVIHAEWIKLRSLRSTPITLAVALLAIIGFGILASAVSSGDVSEPAGGPDGGQGSGASDPVSLSLSGVSLGALVIGVLGVLVISGEYSTGMIRSTLAAVPTRLPVLWAKAIVFGAVAFLVSLVAVLVAFFGGQAFLGNDAAALTDDGVFRTVVGAAVYLAGVGLLGLALGALLRHTAGAIATLVGILILLSTLVGLLPDSWNDAISKYLPANAGSSLMTLHTSTTSLSPGAGFVVFAAWIIVGLGAAAILLRRRDA